MTQFVEFTRFASDNKEVGRSPSRVSVNVEHVTAVTAHGDGGTLLRFVGGGGDEHVGEEYPVVMRTLNR